MKNLQIANQEILRANYAAPREILVEGLDLLNNETPQHIFRTRDPYKIVIRNKSGSDIFGGLSVKEVLFWKVPGYLNAMTYGGLTIYDKGPICQGVIPGNNGEIFLIGRRSQHDVPVEDIEYGFDIFGQNHAIYPYRNKEEYDLFYRIILTFKKFGEFTLDNKKKSRFVKPLYDVVRGVKRIRNQKTLELSLLKCLEQTTDPAVPTRIVSKHVKNKK